MHSIAFGLNYTSPFLHTTKSLQKALERLRSTRDEQAYVVKIDLVGLSGSQRGPPGKFGSQPDAGQGEFGSQPENPVVIDMSSDRHQKAGGAAELGRCRSKVAVS